MCCKNLLVIVSLVFVIGLLRAGEPYKIKYLVSSQGRSNNSVKCIFRDSKGFIWFGTCDGLDRYDGYEFKVFRNRIKDNSSLPHNYISAMNEDDANNLWIGMGQGAVMYNAFTSQVTPVYYTPYNTRDRQRVSMYINSIEKDVQGNMFLGTSGRGIILKLKDRETAIQLPLYNERGEADRYFSVQAVGFSDVKCFREQFTKLFKLKPTDYIKQYRGKVAESLRVDKPDME